MRLSAWPFLPSQKTSPGRFALLRAFWSNASSRSSSPSKKCGCRALRGIGGEGIEGPRFDERLKHLAIDLAHVHALEKVFEGLETRHPWPYVPRRSSPTAPPPTFLTARRPKRMAAVFDRSSGHPLQ